MDTEKHSNQMTEQERRRLRDKDNWGRDVIKAKLTQEIRGELRMDKKKILQLVTHIVTAVLSGLAGFFGGGM